MSLALAASTVLGLASGCGREMDDVHPHDGSSGSKGADTNGGDSAADRALLDEVQRTTFGYCWSLANQPSGMARLRSDGADTVGTGGSGFCVAAVVVATSRGWIARTDAVARLLTITGFLASADRFHGAWPHLLSGTTGRVKPFNAMDNGGDLVETAFLVEGLLIARSYFDGTNAQEASLRDQITQLWQGVDWNFYAPAGQLYWHWSPQYQWESGLTIHGWNEALVAYVLALASPTHPIAPAVYRSGWVASGFGVPNTAQGYTLYTGPASGGPLFLSQYSFVGLDPRLMQDQYTFYWQHNVVHTLINRAYCVYSSPPSYAYSADAWGLTACEGPPPNNYWARCPLHDDGTIAPAAALSSMPYTPYDSFRALRQFHADSRLWGPYGFYDSFNASESWYSNVYLALDEAPIVDMIENYRSGLLWKLFMAAPEIRPALASVGIRAPAPVTGFYLAVPDATTHSVDLMRHPDDGGYELAVATQQAGNYNLTIETAAGAVADSVWSELNVPAGTTVATFGAQLTQGNYVARLAGPASDVTLPITLH